MAFEAPEWLTRSPHRPPNDEHGDADPRTLYTAVGQLTNRWEGVELALLSLFRFIVQGNTGTMRAYGAVIGSGARCDMIDAAVQGMLLPEQNPELTATVKKTLTYVRRLGALRNAVAHGIVANFENEFIHYYQRPPVDRNYFVTPASYNVLKTTHRLGPKIWFNSATVQTISELISELSNEIVETLRPSDPGLQGVAEGWTMSVRRPT